MAEDKRDKRYRVTFQFSATIESQGEADALADAAWKLKCNFNEVHFPCIRVVRELREAAPAPIQVTARAMEEAPYADQVTVHTEESPAMPVIPVPSMKPVNAADDIPF